MDYFKLQNVESEQKHLTNISDSSLLQELIGIIHVLYLHYLRAWNKLIQPLGSPFALTYM